MPMSSCPSQQVILDLIAAVKLCEEKELKVGEVFVNKRRYYSDFQIFVNKLNDKIDLSDVENYFKQFGTID